MILGLGIGLIGCDSVKELKDQEINGIEIGDRIQDIEKSTDKNILKMYSDNYEQGEMVVIEYSDENDFRAIQRINLYQNKVYSMSYDYYSNNKETPSKYEIMDKYKDFDITIDEGAEGGIDIVRIRDDETKFSFVVGKNDSDTVEEVGVAHYDMDKPYEELQDIRRSKEYIKEHKDLLRSELVRVRHLLSEERINEFDEFAEKALEYSNTSYNWK